MLASYLPTDRYNMDYGQFSGDSVYNTTGLQAFFVLWHPFFTNHSHNLVIGRDCSVIKQQILLPIWFGSKIYQNIFQELLF